MTCIYVNRLKIKSIAYDRNDMDIFFVIIRDDVDLVGNDVDILHEEIEHLVGSLSEKWCEHLAWREKSSGGV
jgi:hypothetical protein